MFEVFSTVGSRLGARKATRHELKIAKVLRFAIFTESYRVFF